MSTMQLIPIDGEKLKIAILLKGLSFTQIDRELGFANGYTSKTIRRQSSTLAFIRMLEKLYGIPFSAYEVKEPEPVPPPLMRWWKKTNRKTTSFTTLSICRN